MHTEFGIVALVHNLLKVAGIRQLLSGLKRQNTITGGEKRLVFLHLFYFKDLLDSLFSFISYFIMYNFAYNTISL
ncbi:hypothetical protein, partial [Sporosarcina beigongshangi]|uniref:hypothetical protein n=1 Tax=Sporosarcina beigongshangi TaxID=2782538 RepID=UPI002ACE1539